MVLSDNHIKRVRRHLTKHIIPIIATMIGLFKFHTKSYRRIWNCLHKPTNQLTKALFSCVCNYLASSCNILYLSFHPCSYSFCCFYAMCNAMHSFLPLSLLSLGWENLHASHFVVGLRLILIGLGVRYCSCLVHYHLLGWSLKFTPIHALPWVILLKGLSVVRVKCLLLKLECRIDRCSFFHKLFIWVEICRFNGSSYDSLRKIHILIIVAVIIVWC